MKYTIEEFYGYFRLTIHETGEVREAATVETLLRSLVRDYGFYLRRV
jgi:3'-phosphoadenosine 5'-phosphosulfate sulfotransferase